MTLRSRAKGGRPLGIEVERWGEAARRWEAKTDVAVAVVLALLAVLVRWTHRARTLTGWDSVLFALGVEDYDLMAQRPHPPGYPVYIALAKVLRVVTPDENAALVAVSVLASAAMVVLLYGFMRELGSRRAALAGAGLLAIAPVSMFNGAIALSYACEGAASVAVAWLAWRARAQPTMRRVVALAVVFAAGIGLRQSLFIFLTPVTVWAVWPRPVSRTWFHRIGAGTAAGAATALLWFVPMVLETGGLATWRRLTSLQGGGTVFAESVFIHGWPALEDHTRRLLYFLSFDRAAGWVALVCLAAGLVGGSAAWRRSLALPSAAFWFWLLWIGPSVLFYILIFDGWGKGPTGYVLVLLPGLYAAGAWIFDAAWRRWEAPWPRVTSVAAVASLAVAGVGLHASWQPLLKQEIHDHDEWLEQWLALGDEYPPDTTALLARYSWGYAKWYFPEHTLWSYLPTRDAQGRDWILTLESRDHVDDLPFFEAGFRGPDLPRHPIDPRIETIIVFDFQLAGENGGVRRLAHDVNVTEARLANDWRILLFHPDDTRPNIEDYFVEVPNPGGS